MTDLPEPWPVPRVTGNAQMLLGYISGSLAIQGYYQLVEIRASGDEVIVQSETGNTYRITAEQIGGVE